MKRRKGVTIFGALTSVFVILAGAAFAIIMLVLAPMFAKEAEEAKVIGEAFDIVARSQDILNAFTSFDTNNLAPNVAVFGSLGVFVIVTVIWLIVDLKRDRKICFFFILLTLLATYEELINYFAITQVQDFITKYVEQNPILFVPLGCALLAALASVFSLVLFIVDMATGRVEKPETPTFVKEPTEEVQEGVFEPVQDENEVKKEEEKPAPVVAPAEEEEKVEEEVEEEEEEKPAPKKKPSAPKKVKKEPAAKKAPAKKEPAKKAAPKKAEPKKAEPAKKAAPEAPKADARKTQTIMLTNDDGNNYAKAFHVSRRPELNKWQVKATGSDKALKLFNTQKEAIEYANQLAKNQNVSVRVHSKEGKIRKHNG